VAERDTNLAEIDGVPVVWAESRLPFLCGLVARVGRVDETLLTSGAAHVLEHVVLSTEWPVDEFNASVTPYLTHYWFSGDRDEALERLSATVGAMADVPVDRLERERGILRTEAHGRGVSQASLHASLRYGPTGFGLVAYDEYGLSRLGRAELRAWAARYYARGNVALYMTAAPPDGLDIPLPPGPVVAAPEPRPIPYLEYPSSFDRGPDGGVGISFVVERGDAQVISTEIAEARLRQWLRHRAGVTYGVVAQYEPLTRDLAHVLLVADCLPEHAALVRNVLIAVVDDLASGGPTHDELAHAVAATERWAREPTSIFDHLLYNCGWLLSGRAPETVEERLQGRASVTAEDVAAAAATWMASALVVAPQGTSPLGGRFRPYPVQGRPPRRGDKTYRPAKRERGSNEARLHVGATSVSRVTDEFVSTVAYDDVALALSWPDGTIALWSTDGFYVVVDPAEWKNGAAAADAVRRATREEAAIDLGVEPPRFDDPDLLAADAAAVADDAERAAAALRRGLERAPHEAQAWRLLVWAARTLGRPAEAADAARQALRRDPTDTWSPVQLATLLRLAGRWSEAVEAAREALRRAPTELEPLDEAVAILFADGRHAEAERLAARAVELHPEAAAAWCAHGTAAVGAGRAEEGERSLRRAVELEPEVSRWHNELGWALLERGRADESLAAFDRALKLDPDDASFARLRATALRVLGRRRAAETRTSLLEERLARVREAMGRNPNDSFARADAVELLLGLNRRDEALEQARAAAEVDPTPAVLLLVADVEARLGRFADSEATARRVLDLEPAHAEALDVIAWLGAATAKAEAAAGAAQLLTESHGADRAEHATAYAAAAAGAWDDAAGRFGSLAARRSLDCCAWAWKGIAELEQGRRADAKGAAEHVRRYELAPCPSLDLLAARLG